MTTVYYQQPLNFINFTVDMSNNLRRNGLFNTATKVVVIDPTVFSPASIYTVPQVIAQHNVFSTDYFYLASKQLDTAWTTGGWNITSDAAFLAQLKTWADNNLASGSLIAPMGYNLKMSRSIEYQPEPEFTFDNDGFAEYTYNNVTGVVTYEVGTDLTGVSIGNAFRDSNGVFYNVIAVSVINRTVTIRTIPGNTIPTSIGTENNSNLDGAIFTLVFSEDPTYYTMAFFYPGNQGTPLP